MGAKMKEYSSSQEEVVTEGKTNTQVDEIKNLRLNQLVNFKDHPFKVETNTELFELMQSIEKDGILVPLLARPNPNGEGYELISGHRSKAACEWAGVTEVPVIVRDLDNCQAVIAMVDSNLQRENIKPSEKAFAYRMKLEALKQQGKRSDLTSDQVGPMLENPTVEVTRLKALYDEEGNWLIGTEDDKKGFRSNEQLAKQVGESVNQIKRYIRLTYLIPKILDMVDEGKIAFTIAVELSYLKEEEQYELHAVMDLEQCTIDETKSKNGERWTVKQMESQKKKLEEQLKKLSDESRKDDLITFEELGVDSIMVDEAHNFKNLAIFSKMNNVSGISSSGAQKSTDMQLKCQYLSEINNGRGIVFATGTPISNTMCEMYVMQLYLQKEALEEMEIYHFDSWAANFGEVTNALELTVEGSGFRFKSRFNKFTNLPELMNIFREVADVQTSDMLDLDVPDLRGGKPIIVESEPDWYVKQVMEDFVVRAERIRNGGIDPSEDNFLKITHEARLLGTDARLIDRDAPNNPDGKLNKVAENVWNEYEKARADSRIGCQLIFSDIGTPAPGKEFTVYDYLKESLIQYGI
ncbi:MAG TPA: ParB/RepB/Spo0J family partition protein [Clostridia bacterium]|nr:ParB/RepB/Spo0J family partition protein [Clostridia bacterium]